MEQFNVQRNVSEQCEKKKKRLDVRIYKQRKKKNNFIFRQNYTIFTRIKILVEFIAFEF